MSDRLRVNLSSKYETRSGQIVGPFQPNHGSSTLITDGSGKCWDWGTGWVSMSHWWLKRVQQPDDLVREVFRVSYVPVTPETEIDNPEKPFKEMEAHLEAIARSL